MRMVGALICLGVLVAGCGGTQELLRPTRSDKLYEAVTARGSQLVSVIDSRSHSTDRRLPLGVPTGDWRHIYSIVSTSLIDTDPQTGATRSSIQLQGTYQLPPATANGLPGGLSPNGQWLVVEAFDGSANGMPSSTHMLVIDTTTSKVWRKIDLRGYFRFDAVSNDGDRLYLIQHLNGKEYYVRLYDVMGGKLDDNIVVDKRDGNQAMVGTRLSGVATPDGHWLFSMYVREHESPFIHALSLDGPYAFCLDLPGHGYVDSGAEMHWSLAINRDGSRLYAANPATGAVAVISPGANGAPAVLRTARFDKAMSVAGNAAAANAAVVSADGATLVAAGPAGIAWIDTTSLRVRAHALADWSVSSLGLSPGEQNLYAIGDDGRIAVISMATTSVSAKFDPAEGRPMSLMRVAAA